MVSNCDNGRGHGTTFRSAAAESSQLEAVDVRAWSRTCFKVKWKHFSTTEYEIIILDGSSKWFLAFDICVFWGCHLSADLWELVSPGFQRGSTEASTDNILKWIYTLKTNALDKKSNCMVYILQNFKFTLITTTPTWWFVCLGARLALLQTVPSI